MLDATRAAVNGAADAIVEQEALDNPLISEADRRALREAVINQLLEPALEDGRRISVRLRMLAS